MTAAKGPAHRRHGRPASTSDADMVGLDDLLSGYEEPAPDPVQHRAEPWLGRAAFQAFAASAVVYLLFHLANLDAPYPMILAICVSTVLVRRAIRVTSEPLWHRTADVMKPPRPARRIEPGGWYFDNDGMLDAVRRWDRRLEWGTTAPERFAATVLVRVADLADERLRQRHGITRAQDAPRARRLLGESVWGLLHGPVEQVPTPRQLAAAIDRIESL